MPAKKSRAWTVPTEQENGRSRHFAGNPLKSTRKIVSRLLETKTPGQLAGRFSFTA